MKPKIIFRIIFFAWVFIWLLFLVRGLVKGKFEEFRILCSSRDMYEKNSYILGKELNAFLEVCKREIPSEGTYKIVGDLDGHNRYRLIYHLYPRLQSDNPDYILNIYVKSSQYILKRLK